MESGNYAVVQVAGRLVEVLLANVIRDGAFRAVKSSGPTAT